jgi:hypothetical protein
VSCCADSFLHFGCKLGSLVRRLQNWLYGLSTEWINYFSWALGNIKEGGSNYSVKSLILLPCKYKKRDVHNVASRFLIALIFLLKIGDYAFSLVTCFVNTSVNFAFWSVSNFVEDFTSAILP